MADYEEHELQGPYGAKINLRKYTTLTKKFKFSFLFKRKRFRIIVPNISLRLNQINF